MPNLLEDMTREQLLSLCKRWERAHCDAGIIGSEYYMGPERTFAVVRERQDGLRCAILRLKGIQK